MCLSYDFTTIHLSNNSFHLWYGNFIYYYLSIYGYDYYIGIIWRKEIKITPFSNYDTQSLFSNEHAFSHPSQWKATGSFGYTGKSRKRDYGQMTVAEKQVKKWIINYEKYRSGYINNIKKVTASELSNCY